MNLNKLLGKGNTADVFDIGNGKIVKLFYLGYPKRSVEKEFQNAKLLELLDLPIPGSYNIVFFQSRYGIIYDKINGISLLEVALKTYDVEKCSFLLAAMHKKFLSRKAPSAYDYKAVLKAGIEAVDSLSITSKKRILEILHRLPDGDVLCHGDFHFGNILLSKKENYVIDFMNVCKGHQNFDIARTVYLTEMTPSPSESINEKKIFELKKQAANIYLREMGINREELVDWLIVIASARLSELSSEQINEKNSVLQYLSTFSLH